MGLSRIAGLALVLSLSSCSDASSLLVRLEPDRIASPATASLGGAGASSDSSALPPLDHHDWLEGVTSGDEEVAMVSVANGASSARPIMIGLHGLGDRAGWSCGEWRGVTNGFPFIVCPHGSASHTSWGPTKDTAAQIDGATARVRQDFGAYVAGGPLVVAGFSAGAWTATALVQSGRVSPEALVLAEGAYNVVEAQGFAASMKAHHVKRVLFVCTTRGTCPQTFRAALAPLKRAGIDARVNLASEQGHGFYPGVTFSIRRDWAWLVAGMAGWEKFELDQVSPDGSRLPGKTVLP